MVETCFWEATFSYKSYDLSDCYRLYTSCKNNVGKALNHQTDLSDRYQLYIAVFSESADCRPKCY